MYVTAFRQQLFASVSELQLGEQEMLFSLLWIVLWCRTAQNRWYRKGTNICNKTLCLTHTKCAFLRASAFLGCGNLKCAFAALLGVTEVKQTLWFTELFLTELLPAYWNVLFNGLFSKFILMTCKDAWTSFSLQSSHKILWRVAGFPSFLRY